MSGSNGSKGDLETEVGRLNALVEQLQARVDQMDGSSGTEPEGHQPQSRRDLLKLAGAAMAGAAGTVVLRAMPASAATGGNMVLGNPNDAGATTSLAPSTMTTPTPLYKVTGPAAAAPPVPNATAVPAVPGFLFFAPIQGFGGVVPQSDASMPPRTFNFAEGVDGYAGGTSGTGVAGSSDHGIGVGGASLTGLDFFAFGNGTFAQVPVAAGGSGAPGYLPGNGALELVREDDGTLWISRAVGGNPPPGTIGQDAWKRLNSVRVDKADGTGGFFQPIRIIDTRSSQGSVGGITGPLAAGSTHSWGPINGGVVLGGPNNGKPMGIPSDAVGIVGNVTAAGYGGAGFLAVIPKDAAYNPASSPSSLNFAPPSGAWANSFTVGLGTGGFISIYVGGVASHVIVDLVAYIQ